MAEHFLTDEEREFLSSFSYCPESYYTLQEWAESWDHHHVGIGRDSIRRSVSQRWADGFLPGNIKLYSLGGKVSLNIRVGRKCNG